MKLSFSTLGCPNWSWETILEQAQSMGYMGIEIRGVAGEMAFDRIPQFQPGCEAQTQAQVAAHGLSIVGWGSSVSLHDPNNYDDMVRMGIADIEGCARMGIPRIRVFGNNIIEGQEQETIDRVARGLNALCVEGEKHSVKVLLEIHGDFNTIEAIQPILEKVTSPAFGILWDVAHSDRVYKEAYLPFYRLIRDRIQHVHIKDNDREDHLCLVGEGKIPLYAIIGSLIGGGYDGFCSLEWEKKWHPELPEPEVAFPGYIKYMKNLL